MCERFSLVEICTVSSALPIASSATCVSGAAATKLPPSPTKTLALSSRNARIALTVSSPCSRGGSKPNSFWRASRKCCRRPLPDAHRAVALHVGVAADREQPGARAADVALQERDVADLLDRRDRVAVLGDAHRPADHRRRGVPEHPGGLLDLRPGEVGRLLDGRPVERRGRARPTSLEADRVPLDEVAVHAAPLEQQRADRLHQRQVAVDPDRQVQVGQLGAEAGDAARGSAGS